MDYDVVVIGGGPGGYTAAIRAAQLGLKVSLVEEKEIGGTCLNRGCIPTKVLLNAVDVLDTFRSAEIFGVFGDASINIEKLKCFKIRTIKKLIKGVETLLKSNGVDLLRGKAVFVDNKTIEVKSEKISSTYFIIATGSLPIMPQINGIDNPAVMDSSKALDLESIPEKLLIIGAGVIGLEFACIYQSLGSKVIIVELLEDMLPNLDRDIANILHKALVNKGIKVFFGSKIVKINEYNAIIDVKGEEKIIPFDGVLVAVGRRPNYNGIENLSYLIKDGKIGVNDRMQTEIDNIYAIGDVVGPYQLAHVASYQGIIAASNIAGIDKKISYRAVPSCMYTNPEVSWVGFNERQARDKYGEIKVGRFPYFILPKAVLVGERDGLIKVVADEKNNTILGFSIIGKKATEVIHEAVVAIDAGYTVDAFAQIIHAHPTISEGIKEACEDLLGNPINKLKNV